MTGFGDLTKLNIPKGDAGGELDPHVSCINVFHAANPVWHRTRTRGASCSALMLLLKFFSSNQSYDGRGNPIGGLVFGTAFNGTLRQYHEWTNFMGADYFCFRACLDGPEAPKYCEHVCP